MSSEGHCRCTQIEEESLYTELEKILEGHKGRGKDLIIVLHKAQGLFGYLPRKALEMIALELDVSINEVLGVVTFYNFFSTQPTGRNSIKVCLGTACYVRGGPGVLKQAEKDLGIKDGETTGDRRFSLGVVRCIGACGLAPAMIVNNDVYGRVKTTKIMEILEKYE
ncbi:MAG: NAD(P)H-dependent oxidoreductase subunit E [Syntrophorhabdaceae bacterium]|nr:NAD(P)H-dependent oxidoreductase subunit E [Syntrophorhabdaceae bacterium]